jgi:hypothetical protein
LCEEKKRLAFHPILGYNRGMETERIEVDSTMLKSLEYDHTTGTLTAHFKGLPYAYYNVPVMVFNALKHAAENGESVGKLFHATILKAGYEYCRMEEN